MKHIENHAKSTTVDTCPRCGKVAESADTGLFGCLCFSSVARWWAHRGAGVLLREAERRGLINDGTSTDWDVFRCVEGKLADVAERIIRDVDARQQAECDGKGVAG